MFSHDTHSFIPEFPQVGAFQNARLNDLRQEKIDGRKDLVLDIHSLALLGDEPLLTLLDDDGHPAERVRGEFVPRRFRFTELHWLNRKGLFKVLNTVPSFHEIRSLRGLLHWIPVGGDPYYLLAHGGYGQAGLMFSMEEQHNRRPEVGAVLNLGETKSKWVPDSVPTASESDRWVEKGEGAAGMSAEEITSEAEWVIQKIKEYQSVLVHCVAGFNRSVTICTAVVILLEGLSAEDAYDRVRARHPWARPDTHHWMQLKWLARNRPAPG